MPGSSQGLLAIFMIAIFQVIIETSALANSSHTKGFTTNPAYIVNETNSQYYNNGPQAEAVAFQNTTGRKQGLVQSKNIKQLLSLKRKSENPKDTQTTTDVLKLTSFSNRKTNNHRQKLTRVTKILDAGQFLSDTSSALYRQLMPTVPTSSRKHVLALGSLSPSGSKQTQDREQKGSSISVLGKFLQDRELKGSDTSVLGIQTEENSSSIPNLNLTSVANNFSDVILNDTEDHYNRYNSSLSSPPVSGVHVSDTPLVTESPHEPSVHESGARTESHAHKSGLFDFSMSTDHQILDLSKPSQFMDFQTKVNQSSEFIDLHQMVNTSLQFMDLDKNINRSTHQLNFQENFNQSMHFDDRFREENIDDNNQNNPMGTQIASEDLIGGPAEDLSQQQLVDDTAEGDSNNTCPSCSKGVLAEAEVRRIRVNMFKDLLARKMRMNINDLPDMHGVQNDGKSVIPPPKLPTSILEQTIKDNVQEREGDQFYAKDQELIIAGEDWQDCPRSGVTGCYRFNLKDKVKLLVAEVHLWFYKLKDVNDAHGQTFKVFTLDNNSAQPPLEKLVNNISDAKNVSQPARISRGRYQQSHLIADIDNVTVKEGWVRMNMTQEALKLLDFGRHTQILAIRCTTCRAKSYTSLFNLKQGYKPLLALKYSTSGQVVRSRRSESCDPRYECCRRELVVNFHEISMVEVYQPLNMSIGYCYGDCNESQFINNHTTLQQRMRVSSPYASQPTMSQQLKPCCVPRTLRPAFLMTVEGNEYIRKVIPDVIVLECGCM